MRLIKGLGEAAGQRIAANQPFHDSQDLATRAALSTAELRVLARAGALARLSGHRYQAHWDVAGIQPPADLWKVAEQRDIDYTEVQLPGPTVGQDLIADYSYLTLTLGPHPLQLLRDHPALSGCRTAADLRHCQHGQFIQAAGLVTCRQRPSSASGMSLSRSTAPRMFHSGSIPIRYRASASIAP